jgi:transposase InsO family protein
MIIGRDLMQTLGIDLSFATQKIKWGDAVVPMKPYGQTYQNFQIQKDHPTPETASERLSRILDAKYEKANLEEVVSNLRHLTNKERKSLYDLLIEYEDLFDGTLGNWKNEQLDIELKPGVTPYHARCFPIPRAHEAILRNEVERLVKLGVLRRVNRSEWAAPTFIIPKKDGTVRFISDFRQLNQRIKRKPYPLPKIQDLLLKLEGFTYGTSLDLNMGYYHIELNPDARKLCTIVLPWGKYEYLRLPMGLCNSPDIFQEKMTTLTQDLEFVRVYLDDLLIISRSDWHDHLDKLRAVLDRLQAAGLKVNATKSSFGADQLEYLGYIISREGIQPVPKKVHSILGMSPPTTQRQCRRFIGMVNYYRDMWSKRSELLAPLTELCGKSAKKFQWTPRHQQAFDEIKKVLSKEVMLTYPNFSEPFDIHTDASDIQLGAVISQNNKPIAFYSRKLNAAQRNYTTTERELLAIVETLKEFRNILLGQKIRVFTDHDNLTKNNFTSSRVMRWRLILEEYGPEILYIPGKKNVVADALSRLDIDAPPTSADLFYTNSEFFGITKDQVPPEHIFPLRLKLIHEYQTLDDELLAKAKQGIYTSRTFRGGGKPIPLIVHNDRIVVPKVLQNRVVEWYHVNLCHPGLTRTEATIRQHFTWPNLRGTVSGICTKCDTCQRTKRTTKKWGELPPKEADVNPWDKLCVDTIGKYTLKTKDGTELVLYCVTMIDPATGWFEVKHCLEQDASAVANIVEQTWLSRYPWPQEIVYDRGSEFMAEFAAMVENDYGITTRPITTRNPQANSMIERIHQTMGNIIRTFEIHESEHAIEGWEGILSAVMFALRATVHTTLQATPMQLVFGRDAILNTKFQADWNYIKQRKQEIINANNKRENSKRIKHTYEVGDKVLLNVQRTTLSKFKKNPFKGPYTVLQVNNNGTVQLDMGTIIDTVNIRNIRPYFT